jgi:hypothetical protein
VLSNGGYYQIENGLKIRSDEISELNEKYDELVQEIEDPQPDFDLQELPVMAAGIRALDNARWEFQGASETRQMLGIGA